MDPNQIQNQAQSNIPAGGSANPGTAPLTLSGPTTAAPMGGGGSVADLAAASIAASRERFGSMTATMAQHGYVFDPVAGHFVQDPNFLNPLQRAQLTAEYTPQGIAAQAEAQAQGMAGAAGDKPVDPAELDNFVNAAGKTPDNPNMTLHQLQAAGYKFLSTADKQNLNQIDQAHNLLTQIANASKSINTLHGMGGANNSNFLQMIKGGFENLIGNTAARNLSTNLPAQFTNIVQGIGGSQRFQPAQIAALESALPTPKDTAEQAANKLAVFQNTLDEMRNELISPTHGQSQGKSLSDIFGGH